MHWRYYSLALNHQNKQNEIGKVKINPYQWQGWLQKNHVVHPSWKLTWVCPPPIVPWILAGLSGTLSLKVRGLEVSRVTLLEERCNWLPSLPPRLWLAKMKWEEECDWLRNNESRNVDGSGKVNQWSQNYFDPITKGINQGSCNICH